MLTWPQKAKADTSPGTAQRPLARRPVMTATNRRRVGPCAPDAAG